MSQFSHVPGTVIEKMAASDESIYLYDSDTFRLIASPSIRCTNCDTRYDGTLTLEELTAESATRVPCEHCSSDDSWAMGEPAYAFPCGWGTLFAPIDMCDQRWFQEHKAEVATLGIFVFESEDWGILLGIDAGGFDFYESFWIPLYQLRGLRWHESEPLP